MSFSLPPIAKTAERLLLEIEKAVADFPRKRRSTGEKLSAQAFLVTELVHRAWRDRQNQAALIESLRWEIDALKIRMQLCGRLHAFTSFAQYEMLARIARELGRQAGGWNRQHNGEQHPKGQNGHGGHADAQRAQKLSTRDTSAAWEVYR